MKSTTMVCAAFIIATLMSGCNKKDPGANPKAETGKNGQNPAESSTPGTDKEKSVAKAPDSGGETKPEKAEPNAKAEKPGKSGPPKPSLPPNEMTKFQFRFIRLKHSGKGWDDGMGADQADANFMAHFQKTTGFNARKRGESHSIALLAKYGPDEIPPFVFLTGNGPLGGISSMDAKTLRKYCLKGGMLIADAGSPAFDRSFRAFMRSVFPGKPFIDVSDDDVLYQQPNRFANGAPVFWHHGGSRAIGIKHEGRWIVFYHPGDMNDAWKSESYSVATPEMRKNAMDLGVNLVMYAFNQWNDAVHKVKQKK